MHNLKPYTLYYNNIYSNSCAHHHRLCSFLFAYFSFSVCYIAKSYLLDLVNCPLFISSQVHVVLSPTTKVSEILQKKETKCHQSCHTSCSPSIWKEYERLFYFLKHIQTTVCREQQFYAHSTDLGLLQLWRAFFQYYFSC